MICRYVCPHTAHLKLFFSSLSVCLNLTSNCQFFRTQKHIFYGFCVSYTVEDRRQCGLIFEVTPLLNCYFGTLRWAIFKEAMLSLAIGWQETEGFSLLSVKLARDDSKLSSNNELIKCSVTEVEYTRRAHNISRQHSQRGKGGSNIFLDEACINLCVIGGDEGRD